jgi:hypothetical protein
MSEVLHFSDGECAQARGWMAQFVDGALGCEESARLQKHLEGCAECRVALTEFSKIDQELMAWGAMAAAENPERLGARERLEARLLEAPSRRPMRWVPALVAAIAAALLLAVLPLKKPKPSLEAHAEQTFIEIPYLAPLDPRENATVLRMDIRVSTLMSLGYRVGAAPEAVLPADVLVGEDGRAHAVRVLADVDFGGIGD